MKLIVWLGNPGKEYAKNRHNIWFIMIDNFVNEHNIGPRRTDKSFHAEIIKNNDTIFCKPLTYMNKSWESVKKIVDFYKITPENILIVYDEIDLPTGKIQEKIWWSHAGHNGIKSILHHIQNNNIFTKLRIGVDRPTTKEEVVDRVLWNFSSAEINKIDEHKDIIFQKIQNFINK